MVNWNHLINVPTFASVLPAEYARFARPISEALTVFLGGLPASRQESILTEQASLPFTATASERLALLARRCPSLHKLGQVIARDRRISPELRRQLQGLESLPPAVPLETIERLLAEELGALDARGVALQPPALAEASVAVVVPFEFIGSSAAERPRQGVFKILKPGVEERLEQELELFERTGSYLDARCEELNIPHLDYQEAFEQVRDKLRHEIRLDLEQSNLARARSAYKADSRVLIPALFDHCTARVTAMERVYGDKVTGHTLVSESDKDLVGRLIIEALIAQPIFSKEKESLFHADPHAGNLFLTEDRRLAVLDWSLVGGLGERDRIAMTQITLSALTFQSKRIVSILVGLDERSRIKHDVLASVVESWLSRIRKGVFPGFTWLMGLLDDAVHTARLRVGADLLLFRKTLHTLEGVLADVADKGDRLNRVLSANFIHHFVAEWPQRWWASPNSRNFATRLSNTDLAQFMIDFPWAATRFWLDQFQLMRLE